MTVGVADVSPDLAAVVLGLGQEVGRLAPTTPHRPPRCQRPDIQERACVVTIGRWRDRHGGLVIGRPGACQNSGGPAAGQAEATVGGPADSPRTPRPPPSQRRGDASPGPAPPPAHPPPPPAPPRGCR